MKESFLIDLKNIFINPISITHSNDKKKLVLYIFYFQAIAIAINILAFSITKLLDIHSNSKITDFTFLNIVLVAPIIEEFMFRAILKKKLLNYCLFLVANLYFFRSFLDNIYITIFLILALLFSLFILFKKKYFNSNYNNSQLIILVYVTSFSFGIAHMVNYDASTSIVLFLIVMSITKIISGFLLSMFRIKFGLLYSILFHCFNNSLSFLIIIIAQK